MHVYLLLHVHQLCILKDFDFTKQVPCYLYSYSFYLSHVNRKTSVWHPPPRRPSRAAGPRWRAPAAWPPQTAWPLCLPRICFDAMIEGNSEIQH